MTGHSATMYTEFGVREADTDRIVFRSNPWDYLSAAQYAAVHGGVVVVRSVDKVVTATNWVVVASDLTEPSF